MKNFLLISFIFFLATNVVKSEISKAGSRQTIKEALKEAFQSKSFNLFAVFHVKHLKIIVLKILINIFSQI